MLNRIITGPGQGPRCAATCAAASRAAGGRAAAGSRGRWRRAAASLAPVGAALEQFSGTLVMLGRDGWCSVLVRSCSQATAVQPHLHQCECLCTHAARPPLDWRAISQSSISTASHLAWKADRPARSANTAYSAKTSGSGPLLPATRRCSNGWQYTPQLQHFSHDCRHQLYLGPQSEPPGELR
jgi:hypothetical protein